MSEQVGGMKFINSDQVGDYVSVTLPSNQGPGEDIPLHYIEAGVGEPLLLIHSIGQSLFTWRRVFAELSDNYRVIALDLPGHGYSARPETLAYSMDEMALVLKMFLDAKGIESTHLVAFSMGAMYMLRLLSLYPEYCANCIAINPGGLTDEMPPLIHRIASPVRSVFARNIFSAGDVKKLLEDCVLDRKQIDDYVTQQYYPPLSDGLSREMLMYALRNFDMDIVAEGLSPVEHEVLVLWSKEDPWHPPSGSVYFQGILRAGRYYLVKRAGHLMQEENPDKLLEIIFSYIPPAHPSYNVYRYTEEYRRLEQEYYQQQLIDRQFADEQQRMDAEQYAEGRYIDSHYTEPSIPDPGADPAREPNA